MAIQATAVRGGITIQNAYIMIQSAGVEKYIRPTLDDDGVFVGNTIDVRAKATVAIYSTMSQRESSFSQSDFTYTIFFDHVTGNDLITEAYAAVKEQGLPGWGLGDMVDV